jgi:hypothetical protein
MPKYRVTESHCGDAPERYGTYDLKNDKVAKEWLEKEKKKPSNGYSRLFMERIDVEEKTTHIS